MKNQTAFFTGHRRIPANERPEIQKRLEEELTKRIHQGVQYFGAGGGVCVCYLTNPNSGTAYTVNYARQKELRIINLVIASASPAKSC